MKFPDPPKKQTNPVAFLILMMLMPFFILAKAFIIMMMWEWYIVAHFGIMSMSMAVAFGSSLLVTYLTHSYRKDDRPLGEIVIYSIFFHAFFLLAAYIGSFFV